MVDAAANRPKQCGSVQPALACTDACCGLPPSQRNTSTPIMPLWQARTQPSTRPVRTFPVSGTRGLRGDAGASADDETVAGVQERLSGLPADRQLPSHGGLRCGLRPAGKRCSPRSLVRQSKRSPEDRSRCAPRKQTELAERKLWLVSMQSDVMSTTGQGILRAIDAGEWILQNLASVRERRVKAAASRVPLRRNLPPGQGADVSERREQKTVPDLHCRHGGSRPHGNSGGRAEGGAAHRL